MDFAEKHLTWLSASDTNDTRLRSKHAFPLPSATLLFRPHEVLGDLDTQLLGIPELIQEAVLACPLDAQIHVVPRIVLAGGLCLVDGFKSRLQEEVTFLSWSAATEALPNHKLADAARVWSHGSPQNAVVCNARAWDTGHGAVEQVVWCVCS